MLLRRHSDASGRHASKLKLRIARAWRRCRPEGMPAPLMFAVGMLGLLLLLQVRHLQKVVAQLLHSQHTPRRPEVRTCRSREGGLTD